MLYKIRSNQIHTLGGAILESYVLTRFTRDTLVAYLIPILFLADGRGRVDDLSFFEYISTFCFLSIEFHCTFSMSYKILPYFLCCYSILIR